MTLGVDSRVIGSIHWTSFGTRSSHNGAGVGIANVVRLSGKSPARAIDLGRTGEQMGMVFQPVYLATPQLSRICSANFISQEKTMQKNIYQTDGDGLYLYASVANELALTPGQFNIAFGAYEDAPPSSLEGKCPRRVGDAWIMVADYRTTPLWVVEDGTPYSVGADHEVAGEKVSYPGWGTLPSWLTAVEPTRGAEVALSKA